MIDLSSLKAPGWQRIVAELNAPAPDDRVYFERLLRVLAQVSAARQAVLYVPDKMDGEDVDPRIDMIWPPSEMDKDAEAAAQAAGGGPAHSNVQFANEARTAARAAFGTMQARAFGLDKQEQYYGEGAASGFILAVPMHPNTTGPAGPPRPGQVGGGGPGVPAAVVTLLIEPRSKDAVRSTLAMAEVLAGYVAGHHSRAALRKSMMASFSLDLATRLIASVNTAKTFKGACIQLCNDIAKQFAVDRVALGWVSNDIVRVKAISDIEHFDHRTNMVQKLAAAMDECLDQEQPVLFPAPPGAGDGSDVLLSQAIVHAHRELAAGNAKLRICSLPLRDGEEIVGVVSIESATAGEGGLDLSTVELLQAAMDLIAPMMKVRRSDDRALPLRAAVSARRAAAWVVGTKHTVWKVVGILVIAGMAFVCLYQTTYRPSAEATLEPRVRRMVSMPFDGVLFALGPNAEAGKSVAEGELLIELDTRELTLGLKDAEGKIEQARTQGAAARKGRDQGKAAQAEQQEERAVSEAEVYRERIRRSRIVAPIAGVVIAGDMRDRVGSTMKVGDLMFQIAPLDDIIVTTRVDERDIALIRRAFEEGRGTGEVASKARPDVATKFEIERIVPLATAVEGKNVFEVRCRLEGRPEWFRPGIEGIAKFNTERKPLIWIGTRRILDQIRLWLWW